MSRDALFDLAIARSLSYAIKLGYLDNKNDNRLEAMEIWYLKTRFAYRIPFNEILNTLKTYPNDNSIWQGGKNGDWHKPL